jgi:hypothetical protein
MATTIQISSVLQQKLAEKKLFERETYEEVIWDLLEDSKELNEETKKELQKARNQIKRGEYKTISQIKKEMNL